MNRNDLFQQIESKRSFLCVGLDPDLQKIPRHLLSHSDPIFSFCKEIIDQTQDLAVAYKPNLAFYESLGSKGLKTLERIVDYIPRSCFTIADAKRGDIGNTATMYAKTFFEHYNFDAVTVAPYMGEDSVRPFLEFDEKWVILLALTSNSGAKDFQFLKSEGKYLFEHVVTESMKWGSPDQLMYVVGATQTEDMATIRDIAPEHFFLIPGIGAQGGDLEQAIHVGKNDFGGVLLNSSRGIIYAGTGENFGYKARQAALELQAGMMTYWETV